MFILSGLVLLAALIVLFRTMRSRGSTQARVSASAEAVPFERIRLGVKRIGELKKAVKTAQGLVESAKTAKGAAEPDKKDAARKEVAKAKANLAKAQKRLQFEQEEFDLMMHGQSRFLGPGALQYLVFGIPALVVLVFLMYGIINQVLLPSLASVTVSRGLITFLIAVVTVAIARILVLATVVAESDDRARRSRKARKYSRC